MSPMPPPYVPIQARVEIRSENSTQPGQHCFKNAGGTEICYQQSFDNHNLTNIFDQDGVKDEHNDYYNKKNGAVAGNVPTTDLAASMENKPDQKLAPGNTIFQGHAFDNDEGFRDTHTEDGRNGTSPEYEDHKENANHDGNEYEVHGAKPDGTLTNSEGHRFIDSSNLADVQDKNGENDTFNKESTDADMLSQFHEHHAGDKDNANDSSVTVHANLDQDHVKDEHKSDDFLDFHDENSSKGSVAFKLNGNDAWTDKNQETENLPNELTGRSAEIAVEPNSLEMEEARLIMAGEPASREDQNYFRTRVLMGNHGIFPRTVGNTVEMPKWLAVLALSSFVCICGGAALFLTYKTIRAAFSMCQISDEETAFVDPEVVEITCYQDFPKNDI